MFAFLKQKDLNLDDFISVLREKAKNRQLDHILSALCKNRNRLGSFRGSKADGVFLRLKELSRATNELIEGELTRQNIPPKSSEKVLPEKYIWNLVSYIIFPLNPILSDQFVTAVFKSCLIEPTNLVFGLLHSEAIEPLAKNHPALIDTSLIEIIISSTDDSRSIYALRIAKWIPEWDGIKAAVFKAMFADNPVIRSEARWLINKRATLEEVLAWLENAELTLSQTVMDSRDVRKITAVILTNTFGSANYAVRGSGKILTPAELEEISARIRKRIDEGRKGA